MTTAPQENRGGNRPLAPQNNTGVSGVGGNGSADGVPNIDYTGFAYSQNKATNDQMHAAKLGAQNEPAAEPLVGMFDKTQRPDQVLSHGADAGDGPDSSSLILPAMATPQIESPIQVLQAIYMQDPTNQDARFALEKLQQQGRI